MSFISTVPAAQAVDEVADLYHQEQGSAGYLPNYAAVFSHRPQVMAAWSALQTALKQHLDTRTYCLVNLAAARASHSSYCSLAYGRRLLRKHFSDRELIAVLEDTPDSPLSKRESAAMQLAAQVARDASRVTGANIQVAREAGYSDAEIFDIVAAAAGRCFFSRIPDALGALPDAALGDLAPELMALLLVGRPLVDQ